MDDNFNLNVNPRFERCKYFLIIDKDPTSEKGKDSDGEKNQYWNYNL
jgi:hypothetical protein